jgi:hypothetical protein
VGGVLATEKPQPVRLSLEEARRTVRLMDDIYQSGVMTTHSMYVRERGDAAAVTWGRQVMGQMNAKGWPEGRIFGATDRPLNPESRFKDTFEQEAAAAFRAGKTTFEKVEGSTLRYASEIRAVDKSCIMCHTRNKEGDLLGGVSYRALLHPAPAK